MKHHRGKLRSDFKEGARPFPGVTHPRKRAFLRAYSRRGHVGEAAAAAKISRDTHKVWRRKDPLYALAFAEAQEMATEALEREADRRAVEGVDRPIFYQGRQVGTTKEYSDVLLIFRLKALAPKRYRDLAVPSGGGGLTLNLTFLSTEDLRRLRDIRQRYDTQAKAALSSGSDPFSDPTASSAR